jgi:hypothetical protein
MPMTDEEKRKRNLDEIIKRQNELRQAHAQKQAGNAPQTTSRQPANQQPPLNPAETPPKSKAWLWSLGTTIAMMLITFAIIAAVFATIAAPLLPAFLVGLGSLFGALALGGIGAGGVMVIGAAVTSGIAYANRRKDAPSPEPVESSAKTRRINPALGTLAQASTPAQDLLSPPLTARPPLNQPVAHKPTRASELRAAAGQALATTLKSL